MANNTMNFGVDLLPTQDNTYSLGDTNHKWKNIYATNINIETYPGSNNYSNIIFTGSDGNLYKHSNFRIYQRTSGGPAGVLIGGNDSHTGTLTLAEGTAYTTLVPTYAVSNGTIYINLPSSAGTLVVGSGTSGSLAKFDENNKIIDGPAIGTDTTKFLNNKGEWATPPDTKNWAAITGKPTTLSGYGITDAKIANGVITLGSNTITPLTSHQDITGKADKSATVSTLTWDSTNKKITKTINGTTSDVVQFAKNGSVTLSSNATTLTISATDTTYTFTNGTNSFKVTSTDGTEKTVTVTPYIANNITGSGTNGSLAKFDGINTLTAGPAITSTGTGFLKEDGNWENPPGDHTVTQTNTTKAAAYRVLFSFSPNNTSNTGSVRKSEYFIYNPGSHILTLSGDTDATSTTTGTLIVSGGIGCAKSIRAASVWGAVWNDYAEFRKDNPEEKELQQPGRCVREVGDGTLTLTDGRLQRGCEIISDTFGFAIGQDKENGYNTPIASSGRVLAYLYEDRELARSFIGWPVCSGPNGTVSIMTEEEENRYSNRIVGTISEIPDYEEWGTGKVKVNGRIWIRIK